MQKTVFLAGLLAVVMMFSGCDKFSSGGTSVNEESESKNSLVLSLDDSSFDAAIASGVVLVDFWASWCPPCRKQLPLVDKAAEQLAGKAKVAKVNVDKGKKTATRFGVQSIPTLIIFKDGKEVKKFVGLTQPDELVAAVNAAL